MVQLMLYSKFQPKISSGSGEKVDFKGLAIFSNSGHFYSPPGSILSFRSPAASSCSMWNLRTMGAVVLEDKSFEWT